MRRALHDLSQPLTALECRLYLGTMPAQPGREPQATELQDTIREALIECERLIASVRSMQDRLSQAPRN